MNLGFVTPWVGSLLLIPGKISSFFSLFCSNSPKRAFLAQICSQPNDSNDFPTFLGGSGMAKDLIHVFRFMNFKLGGIQLVLGKMRGKGWWSLLRSPACSSLVPHEDNAGITTAETGFESELREQMENITRRAVREEFPAAP